MAWFGRRKDTPAEQDDLELKDDVTGEDSPAEAPSQEEPEDTAETSEEERRRRSRLRPRDEVDLSNGPFDIADAPKSDERLDFGALAVPAPEDAELRLDVDESTQMITGMTAVLGSDGHSAVQLQVFAAPKTSGIWYGIRREIAEALVAGGGTAEEVEGTLGTELHVRMPNQGPDGRTTFSPARFIGVDGPRWFLRAVLSGQAAVDDEAAEEALAFVRTVVVRRGGEARAPRELLELTLPPELQEQVAQVQADEENAQNGTPSEAAGIERLERGPEITETR